MAKMVNCIGKEKSSKIKREAFIFQDLIENVRIATFIKLS